MDSWSLKLVFNEEEFSEEDKSEESKAFISWVCVCMCAMARV